MGVTKQSNIDPNDIRTEKGTVFFFFYSMKESLFNTVKYFPRTHRTFVKDNEYTACDNLMKTSSRYDDYEFLGCGFISDVKLIDMDHRKAN